MIGSRSDSRDIEHLKTYAIINPRSAGGATGRKLKLIQDDLRKALGNIAVQRTSRPMHAAELARAALLEGAELIVAVGGDGTVGEVVNGFFDRQRPGVAINSAARLGVVMSGTGGDIRRTYGLGSTRASQIGVLSRGLTRGVDVGYAEFADHDGAPTHRYFINTLSFGMTGQVCQSVKRGVAGWFSGKSAFLIASLLGALRYRNRKMLINAEEAAFVGRFNSVVVANGQYFGGSMHIAPTAKPHDGEFELITLGDLSRFDIFRSMPMIYRGSHLSHPKVSIRRIQHLHAEAVNDAPILIEMDGEGPGRLPVTVRLFPRVLPLVVPEVFAAGKIGH